MCVYGIGGLDQTESADTVAAPASPARRPPHALSIDDDDDDAMDEVDSHEHDWRFAASETGQQEEAAATIPRQPAGHSFISFKKKKNQHEQFK